MQLAEPGGHVGEGAVVVRGEEVGGAAVVGVEGVAGGVEGGEPG